MTHPLQSGTEHVADLVEVLQWRARWQPHGLAYVFSPDGITEKARLTYGELDALARAMAANLSRSASPGDRALLICTSSQHQVAAFFGCLYASVIAVPVAPPRLHRRNLSMDAIARNARPALIITEDECLGMVRDWCCQSSDAAVEDVLRSDRVDPAMGGDWTRTEIDRHGLAFLQYTSGSTAMPKGVMVTHDNLMCNCAGMAASMQPEPDDRVVSWLPLFHDMGLIGQALFSLYIGMPCVLMPPAAFNQRPLSWLQAITRHRGTISFAPNSAYEACIRSTTPEERSGLDLSSWRLALNGAEPVRAHTLDRFTEVFAPCGFRPAAFYPGYGLAESTLWVSGGPVATPPSVLAVEAGALEQMQATVAGASSSGRVRTLVACGRQSGPHTLAIVDPTTRLRSSKDRIGEIWIRGPSVATGYWHEPEKSAETFQAQIADTHEGPFLRSGDLGFLDRGNLYITGRVKDLIILHGRNIYPQDIEREVEDAHASIQTASAAAFSLEFDGEEHLAVMLEVKRTHRNRVDPREIMRAVRHAIADAFAIPSHVIGVLRPGAIPKTSSGKLMRHACRYRYLAGELPLIAQWLNPVDAPDASLIAQPDPPVWQGTLLHAPPARRKEILRGMIRREVAGLTDGSGGYTEDDGFIEMGLDSLMIAQLAHNIRCHLPPGTPCTPATLFRHHSVRALTIHLHRIASPAPSATQVAAEPRATDPGRTPSHRASVGQERLWFLGQWTPHLPLYNLPFTLRFSQPLSRQVLQRAISDLVARHEALRSVAEVCDGHLQLQIRDPAGFELRDLTMERGSPPDDPLTQCIRAEIRRPFDLAAEPPIRFLRIHTKNAECILLVIVHHTAADAISLNILTEELLTHLETGALPDPRPGGIATGFSHYARDEHKWIRSRQARDDLAYWEEQLRDVPAVDLPGDRPRPTVMTHHGASWPLALGPDVADALIPFCRSAGVTPFMCLAAALDIVLARYSGQSDITIGTPVSIRPSARFASVVGHFVNMVALRVELDPDGTVHDLLRNVRAVAGAAYVHQTAPFDHVVRHVNPRRDPGRTPFFQTVLALQPRAEALAEPRTRMGATRQDLRSELGVAQNDLTLDLVLTPAGIHGFIAYNTDIFDAWRIRQFATHFETCLRRMMSDPGARLAELDVIGVRSPAQKGAGRSAAMDEVPGPACLPAMIADQAVRTPNAVAVQCGDRAVTYAILMDRVNRLAGSLQRGGVQRESRVGVCMDRTIDMVVALLAVLRAHGAYIPMDPDFPPRRLAAMIEHAEPVLILADPVTSPSLGMATSTPIRVLGPDRDHGACHEAGEADISPVDPSSYDLAYVIYTSGTTGEPKGVQVEHGSLVNLLQAMRVESGIGVEDALLAVTTISFDIAALELFLPLVSGGRVMLAPRSVAIDGIALAHELTRTGATIMQGTPATWRMLMMSGRLEHPHLTALCGGEALPAALARQIQCRTGRLLNLYGPTETTIWSTVHEVCASAPEGQAGPYVPLGHPLANTRLHILDDRGRHVPDGISGELYIGGAGVARGYLNQPGLTDERFVSDPFSAHPGRLFRTGDLVQSLPDGTLAFLGRTDLQVKVRGTRIEPGEVERALCQAPGVSQAVVMARVDQTGEHRLVAYLVTDDAAGAGPDAGSLRRHLQQQLPDSMIPSCFVRLPAFPLTPHEKLDRNAFPVPEELGAAAEVPRDRPVDTLERMIMDIWIRVLGVAEIGLRENFFDLGGHSLLLVQVQTELVGRGHPDITVVDLFRYPSVEGLARFLDRGRVGDALPAPDPRPPGDGVSREDVSARQRALRHQTSPGQVGRD